MTTEQLIERLKERKEKGPSYGASIAVYHDELDEVLSRLTTLEKRAEAGEKLAESVSRYGNSRCACKGSDVHCIHSKLDEHLSAHRSATQDSVREE